LGYKVCSVALKKDTATEKIATDRAAQAINIDILTTAVI